MTHYKNNQEVNIPDFYEGNTNYKTRTDLHLEHGFKPLEVLERPTPNKNQKLEVVYTEHPTKVVKSWNVIDLTEAELRERFEQNTPNTIKPAQGRKQLRVMGLFDAVNQHITNSGNTDLIDFWEYATEWNLESETINSMAEMLQIDKYEFFTNANGYKL